MDLPLPDSGTPSPAPVYTPETSPSAGSNRPAWLRFVLIAAIVVIVVLGLIFGLSGSHKTANKTTSSNSKSASSQPAQGGASAPQSAANGSSQSSNNSSSDNGFATGSGSANQLVNTGPGETVALFATTVVGGTAAYQFMARRRASDR